MYEAFLTDVLLGTPGGFQSVITPVLQTLHLHLQRRAESNVRCNTLPVALRDFLEVRKVSLIRGGVRGVSNVTGRQIYLSVVS